jgi:predicted metal-binding membrane protein
MVQDAGTAVFEERASWARERAFLGASTFLFLASVSTMIYLCARMSGGMPMPGGWTMSMAWMRMPGQSWFSAAATFLGMWAVMMVAMMLPSLLPVLSIYRRSLRLSGETQLGIPTALAGAGYFFVWTVFGALSYLVGVGLVAIEMNWLALAQSVPIAIGVVLLVSGFIQFTAWKARELRHCRNSPAGGSTPADARSAWQRGLRLGVHCSLCCSGLMMVLLVTGVMSLGVMTMVAAAVAVERLAPKPERTARVLGIVIIAAGVLVIARALGVV